MRLTKSIIIASILLFAGHSFAGEHGIGTAKADVLTPQDMQEVGAVLGAQATARRVARRAVKTGCKDDVIIVDTPLKIGRFGTAVTPGRNYSASTAAQDTKSVVTSIGFNDKGQSIASLRTDQGYMSINLTTGMRSLQGRGPARWLTPLSRSYLKQHKVYRPARK